jgi:hypothetical protein
MTLIFVLDFVRQRIREWECYRAQSVSVHPSLVFAYSLSIEIYVLLTESISNRYAQSAYVFDVKL